MTSTAPAAAASAPAAAGAAPPQTTIQDLLSSVKLGSLPVTKERILRIDSKTPLTEAFQQLIAFGVLGAPVYDATAQAYLGFLDIRDLVRYIVFRYDQAEAIALVARTYEGSLSKMAHALSLKKPVPPLRPHAPETSALGKGKSVNEFIDELIASGEALHGSKLSVVTLAERHPFVAFPEDATLYEAALEMCGEARRVCVIDSKSAEVTNVISQSTVIDFIAKNLARVALEAGKPVDTVGTRPVRKVPGSMRTINVFRRMCDTGFLSGVPVVDEYGSFVDSVNARDLKVFLSSFYSSANIELEILTFLKELRQLEANKLVAPRETHHQLAMCSSTGPTLGHVIARLSSAHSHQLYITSKLDDRYRYNIPVMCVSLGDVLRSVLKPMTALSSSGAAGSKQVIAPRVIPTPPVTPPSTPAAGLPAAAAPAK